MSTRPVRRSLSWKIAAAFLLSALISVSGIGLFSWKRENQRLGGEQREGDLRLAQQINGLLDRASILANTLANVAVSGQPSSWTAQVQRLVFSGRAEPAVAALGIWPEPQSRAGKNGRESRLWLVGSDGTLHLREDYND